MLNAACWNVGTHGKSIVLVPKNYLASRPQKPTNVYYTPPVKKNKTAFMPTTIDALNIKYKYKHFKTFFVHKQNFYQTHYNLIQRIPVLISPQIKTQ